MSILVEIGIVLSLLLNEGKDPGRRLVPGAPARDRCPHGPALDVVDANPLFAEGDNRQSGGSRRTGRDELDGLVLFPSLSVCGPKRRAEDEGCDAPDELPNLRYVACSGCWHHTPPPRAQITCRLRACKYTPRVLSLSLSAASSARESRAHLENRAAIALCRCVPDRC